MDFVTLTALVIRLEPSGAGVLSTMVLKCGHDSASALSADRALSPAGSAPARLAGSAQRSTMMLFSSSPLSSSSSPDRTSLSVSRRALLGAAGTAIALGSAAALASPAAAATTLRRGDRGAAVTALQKRLNALGYWCGTADGSFGALTQQAVWALQKAAGLTRDGIVGPRTRAKLDAGHRPSARAGKGTTLEVDLKRQLLLVVHNGRLRFILNTSTGSGERYRSGDRWATATTPTGRFQIFRRHSAGWQTAPLGRLYRPVYYYKGWAVHGSTSIPPYPASHGCARVSVAAMDMLWSTGMVPVNRRVHVY